MLRVSPRLHKNDGIEADSGKQYDSSKQNGAGLRGKRAITPSHLERKGVHLTRKIGKIGDLNV